MTSLVSPLGETDFRDTDGNNGLRDAIVSLFKRKRQAASEVSRNLPIGKWLEVFASLTTDFAPLAVEKNAARGCLKSRLHNRVETLVFKN